MDEIVRQVARLMKEQTDSYAKLDAVAVQLNAALVRGEPDNIEAITRTGESELLRMRSRLLQITAALTRFAEARENQTEKTPLDPQVREQFESSAKNLLDAARQFEKLSTRAKNLALGGTSFANACIQTCGVAPLTYRAPVLKQEETGR